MSNPIQFVRPFGSDPKINPRELDPKRTISGWRTQQVAGMSRRHSFEPVTRIDWELYIQILGRRNVCINTILLILNKELLLQICVNIETERTKFAQFSLIIC